MLMCSATDVAIAVAMKAGTLTVKECDGRFGAYLAIEDDRGVIEVHLTEDDAEARLAAIGKAVS